MSAILEKFQSIEFLDLIRFVFLLVFAVLTFVKTCGNKKNFLEVLSEMKELNVKCGRYRTENYQDTEKVAGQTFSNLKPVYRLNKSTGELEKTEDVIDLQELINSCKDVCLNAILDRFLPESVPESDSVAEFSEMQGDLDYLQEAFSVADEYRAKYGLDEDMSVQDVFAYVNRKAGELKAKIDLFKSQKVQKKEVEDNVQEEEIIEKGE